MLCSRSWHSGPIHRATAMVSARWGVVEYAAVRAFAYRGPSQEDGSFTGAPFPLSRLLGGKEFIIGLRYVGFRSLPSSGASCSPPSCLVPNLRWPDIYSPYHGPTMWTQSRILIYPLCTQDNFREKSLPAKKRKQADGCYEPCPGARSRDFGNCNPEAWRARHATWSCMGSYQKHRIAVASS